MKYQQKIQKDTYEALVALGHREQSHRGTHKHDNKWHAPGGRGCVLNVCILLTSGSCLAPMWHLTAIYMGKSDLKSDNNYQINENASFQNSI